MTWLVLTILATCVFTAGVMMAVLGSPPDPGSDRLGLRFPGIAAAVTAVAIILALSIGFSIHRLGTGQVALVYSFSGKLTGAKLEPGIVNTWPWEHVTKENVFVQREEFALGRGNSAVSSDQQPIFAHLALNYEVDPNDVIDLYRKVGPTWKAKLIDSRVLQTFKEVTAGFTAQEMTSERRALREQTRLRLAAELRPYSITVVDFFIANLGYSDAYSDAIEAKNKQIQETARQQARVAQSEAEADQLKKKADGEAYAIRVQGRALRENPEVLRLRAIEKLNPQAQVIYVPTDTNLFLNTGAGGK